MKHLSNEYILAGGGIMRNYAQARIDDNEEEMRAQAEKWLLWFSERAVEVTMAVAAMSALEYLAENIYLEEMFVSEIFQREVERRTLPEVLISAAIGLSCKKKQEAEAAAAAHQEGGGCGQG